jgi:hypothetical protein
MDRHYQLKVTSDTTNIDVDSIDADEVSRIVQLAGLKGSSSSTLPTPIASPAPTEMPASVQAPAMSGPSVDGEPEMGSEMDEQTCSICGASDHDEHECPQSLAAEDIEDMSAELDEEMAEFDHGHQEVDDEGEEVDVGTYVYQPDRLPQHFGKQGDNTLNDPLTEKADSIFHNLQEAYKAYISEAENEDGSMSPLSDPTKPEFDKDPFSGDKPVDDGSRSPMSTVKRQPSLK